MLPKIVNAGCAAKHACIQATTVTASNKYITSWKNYFINGLLFWTTLENLTTFHDFFSAFKSKFRTSRCQRNQKINFRNLQNFSKSVEILELLIESQWPNLHLLRREWWCWSVNDRPTRRETSARMTERKSVTSSVSWTSVSTKYGSKPDCCFQRHLVPHSVQPVQHREHINYQYAPTVVLGPNFRNFVRFS